MEQPAALQTQLLAAKEVQLFLRGTELSVSASLVASAFYLRKLAVATAATGGGFVVRVEDEEAAQHVRAFLVPRSGVAAFLRWIDAADFLLALPPPEATLACLCTTLGWQLRSPELRSPTLLTRADCNAPALVAVAGVRAYEGYSDAIATDPEAAEEQEEPWLLVDFLAKVERSYALLFVRDDAAAPSLAASNIEFELLRRLVVSTVLRRLHSPSGALEVLKGAAELLAVFAGDLGQWLVHRALRTLYCAESTGLECSVPLATAAALQTLYVTGRLDLDSFLPVLRTAARRRALLPGLRGRTEVGLLCRDERELDRRVARLVPWLEAAAHRGPVDLHLSGSMLCHALHDRVGEAAADPDWPGPSDVDIFCDRKTSLEGAREQIGGSLSEYATWACGATAWQVRASAPNDSRRKLSIEAAILDRNAAFHCDLYVNSRRQALQYHLPQVRASWDLRRRRLFMAPSCAIALVTGLNVDCHLFAGRTKTPCEILANKWLWGFNVCLAFGDAEVMVAYLRERHPEAARRAEAKARPCSLAARSYATLERHYGLLPCE
jgi:hypothetical protein